MPPTSSVCGARATDLHWLATCALPQEAIGGREAEAHGGHQPGATAVRGAAEAPAGRGDEETRVRHAEVTRVEGLYGSIRAGCWCSRPSVAIRERQRIDEELTRRREELDAERKKMEEAHMNEMEGLNKVRRLQCSVCAWKQLAMCLRRNGESAAFPCVMCLNSLGGEGQTAARFRGEA